MNEFGKKFDWVLLLSLVVIVGGIIFLVFMGVKFGIFNNFLNNSAGQNDISALETKYCGYAKKTLDWMDKKRKIDEKYALSLGCYKEGKKCSDLLEIGQNDIPILWARYKYFLKNQDQGQLALIKKGIDVYVDQLDKTSTVNNGFWNCRILTEMRDEKVLGADYVGKIDNICKTGRYLSTENLNEDENGKIIISDLANFNWDQLTDKDLNNLKQDKKIDGEYSFYVTYPSDFVAKYKTWNDKADLDVANAYFNKLMIEYKLNYKSFLAKDVCLMAVSSLDLFSVNKDDKYLKWAMFVYDNYFNENEIFPQAKVPECAFLARELVKYDDNRDYKSSQNKLLDFFIENYWDGDQSKNKISGTGGFFRINKNSFLEKLPRENALIVNLLCP